VTLPAHEMGGSHSLEEAMRVARAASHSRRLDTATQAALDALVAFSKAVVDRIVRTDLELNEAQNRIAALEAARVPPNLPEA
jgi:hypothetical protein